MNNILVFLLGKASFTENQVVKVIYFQFLIIHTFNYTKSAFYFLKSTIFLKYSNVGSRILTTKEIRDQITFNQSSKEHMTIDKLRLIKLLSDYHEKDPGSINNVISCSYTTLRAYVIKM